MAIQDHLPVLLDTAAVTSSLNNRTAPDYCTPIIVCIQVTIFMAVPRCWPLPPLLVCVCVILGYTKNGRLQVLQNKVMRTLFVREGGFGESN
jgi:hypothetical protein